MKGKELIQLIKDYEDFDIEIADINSFNRLKIKGISDIGHSSKILSLEVQNG